jgi:hypothetical protein
MSSFFVGNKVGHVVESSVATTSERFMNIHSNSCRIFGVMNLQDLYHLLKFNITNYIYIYIYISNSTILCINH